jgi:hypothetical protein
MPHLSHAPFGPIRDRFRFLLGLEYGPAFETPARCPRTLEDSYMRRVSLVLLAALAVAGCKKQQSTAAAQPQDAAAAQSGASASIQGKVLERLDAPPDYSYLRLETAKGETWAAVPRTEVAVGSDVTVTAAMPMNGFESKTLNRKFELVYFGRLEGDAGAPPAGPGPMGGAMGGTAAGQMPPGHQPMGGAMGGAEPANMAAQHRAAAAGPAEVGDVKVPKASGADARTVAEVWSQRTALNEKPVTIRGKVVKFNGGIMGRNWVHLRDGSGTAGKDNDVTVTTADEVAVGDVVVVKGVVRVDKDFGAGYAYPVIVEDAKLSK